MAAKKILQPQTSNVIKSHDFISLVEKEQEKCAQSEEAKSIISKAESIQKEAYEKGFQSGEIDAQKKMVQEMLDFESKLDQAFNSIEDEVCALILQSVKTIIDQHEDSEIIQMLVKKGLNMINENHSVLIRAHPDTLPEIKNIANVNWSNRTSFESVPHFSVNQVNLVSEAGSIRLDLNNMMQALEQAFHCDKQNKLHAL